jgi:hypothetical protein
MADYAPWKLSNVDTFGGVPMVSVMDDGGTLRLQTHDEFRGWVKKFGSGNLVIECYSTNRTLDFTNAEFDKLTLTNLPTNPTGRPSGSVWHDTTDNTLKIVP